MKDIMGIEIENMSAASAVRRIMGLLAREPLSVCTVLRRICSCLRRRMRSIGSI